MLLDKKGHKSPNVGHGSQLVEGEPLVLGAPPECLHDGVAEIDLYERQNTLIELRRNQAIHFVVDVLHSFGDLTELFSAIARCATAGAQLVFSVERAEEGGVELRRHARFTHSLEHIEEAAAKTGWRVTATRRTPVRVERGHEVDGLLVVQQLLGPVGAVERII